MTTFAPGEISDLRSFQQLTLTDTCIIQTFSEGTPDSYGQKSAPSYTDGTPIKCGFWYKGGMETRPTILEATVFKTDAGVRLPSNSVVTELDRIKITHRYGTALQTPLVFEIISPIKQGPTGIVLDLQTLEL